MSIQEKIDNYKKTLSLFPNPQEKYQYLIEQAKFNDDFPENLKIDELVDFKINLKTLNKNNKEHKKKIIPLKILANSNSTSR